VKQIRGTNEKLFAILDSFDESHLNTVPYANSWTAAQVGNHLTKSDRFITQLVSGPTVSTERAADEYVKQLADTFLNFDEKLVAPEMIIPDEKTFTKAEVLTDIKSTRSNLLNVANSVDLTRTTSLKSPFGKSTLLELLHFHLYHTKRHIHQLEKIRAAVSIA